MVPADSEESRVRVVVAEDEAIIRLDLVEILADIGYDVVGDCGRGDEALELVRELRPDVVILDIKMPGIDGLAVAREVSEDQLAAVLILTAFSQRDLVGEAADSGAMAYLVKPFQRTELVPAVEVALARFRQMKALTEEVRGLGERLESRKVIDRAKGVLMDQHGLAEADAFAWIQKSAMSRRVTMREVADDVLAGSHTIEWPRGQGDAD
jgi:AmiR/NasT family two-component response regulator